MENIEGMCIKSCDGRSSASERKQWVNFKMVVQINLFCTIISIEFYKLRLKCPKPSIRLEIDTQTHTQINYRISFI